MLKVSEAALDYALAHIIPRSDTDVLPPAFEFNAIFHDWDAIKKSLASQDLDSWVLRSHRMCLSPKRGLGFRVATQLDPLDAILLTALVYEAGTDLEARRVPTTANIVHSHRFGPLPNGQLYDPAFGWDSFRQQSLSLASSLGGFVVATDIADFFPRLYHHPLENALLVACGSKDHARVIYKLLRGLNQGVSHGVPVGPAAVRLLAEVTIDDVDQALLSEGYTFCRYSDDYRIFVRGEGDGRKALAFLANTLLRNHGLTLQESKTELIDARDFVSRFARDEEDAARLSLGEKFESILAYLREKEWNEWMESDEPDNEVASLGFLSFSRYAEVSFEDLEPDQQAVVASLNLWELLSEEIQKTTALDASLVRFVLRRIADLKLKGPYDLLLDNLDRLYPVFPQVLQALAAQAFDDDVLKVQLGQVLLDLLHDPVVGHLEYHRAWILSVFAADAAWNHSNNLLQLLNTYIDSMTRNELILAIGTAGVAHWFRARKTDITSLPPWERRAFLAGARCLPKDEANHWYQSVTPQLDLLERAVVKYSRTFLK